MAVNDGVKADDLACNGDVTSDDVMLCVVPAVVVHFVEVVWRPIDVPVDCIKLWIPFETTITTNK